MLSHKVLTLQDDGVDVTYFIPAGRWSVIEHRFSGYLDDDWKTHVALEGHAEIVVTENKVIKCRYDAIKMATLFLTARDILDK